MFSTTRRLLWCVLCLVISSGTCAVYNMTCDPGSLVLNDITTSPLEGTVDTSVINPTDCTLGVTKAIFQITPRDSTAIKICEIPFQNCPSGFHQMGRQECRCESSSGNLNTYQLKFFFDETYLKGVLKITSNCLSTKPTPSVHCTNITDLCLNKTCNGHGTCNRTTGGTCNCDPGYEGENCDISADTTQPPTPDISIPANTTQPPTPDPIPPCKCCECSNCKDTGGCWICILLIVIIIVCLVILCISIYCCCCCCFCYWCCREKTEQRLGRIYKRIDRNLGKTPKGTSDNQDEGTRMAESADKPTNPNSLPGSTEQPTIPNSTKRGKQTAEKSDMNELRDIPSSPDQDERLHPAKGSRDLPQPRGGGGGQVNVTHSNTPRSLLPVQAVTPLPSVERNSYAESRKLPLPSIDSKDAH